jgi:hypothetical protein
MLETERYAAVRSSEVSMRLDHTSLWEPWRAAYRRNVLAVGMMHFFRFLLISAGVFWWPYYAQVEVGMSIQLTRFYLGVAGIVGAVGFMFRGRLMDRWGRRPVFILYTGLAAAFGIALFQIHSSLWMLPVLCLADLLRPRLGCHDVSVRHRGVPDLYIRETKGLDLEALDQTLAFDEVRM